MANVYTFNPNEPEEDFDRNNSNYQLASIAYINSVVKKLIDAIEDHLNDPTAHQSCPDKKKLSINALESIDIHELNIEGSKLPSNAKDINTDPSHRFISDTEINNLKSKPSTTDMQNAIMDLRNELKSTIESAYIDLLNTPDVLQKLKNVAYVLKADPNLDKTITDLASRITKNEFKDHIDSNLHLSNEEHEALSILINLIKSGCADWNAHRGTPNYIRHKPDSLPANGGDADTVGGYSVKDIMNHQAEEYIYGTENELYPEEEANTIILNDTNIDNYISMICEHGKGLFLFKTGKYSFSTMICSIPHDNDTGFTIRGSNNRSTIFIGEIAKFNGRVTVKDLAIKSASVHIESLCTLDNVYFNSCKISLDSCNEATIRDCIFENCIIEFNGTCLNTIITGNRFIKSGRPQYYNSSNLFANNLYY